MKQIKSVIVALLVVFLGGATVNAATPGINIDDGILSLTNIESSVTAVQVDIEFQGEFLSFEKDENLQIAVEKVVETSEKVSIYIVNGTKIADDSGYVALGEIIFAEETQITTSALTTVDVKFVEKNYNKIVVKIDDKKVSSTLTGSLTVMGTVTEETENEENSTDIDKTEDGWIFEQFSDISGHWAQSAIEFVVDRGLYIGVTKTTFEPETMMDRAMFVTVLSRFDGATLENADCIFTDVNANSWYSGAVNWAIKSNIVSTNNDVFEAKRAITREEMALFMYNYLNEKDIVLEETYQAVNFDDADLISEEAFKAVQSMQKCGVLMGKNDNKFDPSGIATRAEVATMIQRLAELMD